MGVFNFLGSPHHFHKFLEIGSKTLLDIPGAKNEKTKTEVLDVLPCVLILKHARLINSWLWRGGASIAAQANIHVLRRDRVPGRSAREVGRMISWKPSRWEDHVALLLLLLLLLHHHHHRSSGSPEPNVGPRHRHCSF